MARVLILIALVLRLEVAMALHLPENSTESSTRHNESEPLWNSLTQVLQRANGERRLCGNGRHARFTAAQELRKITDGEGKLKRQTMTIKPQKTLFSRIRISLYLLICFASSLRSVASSPGLKILSAVEPRPEVCAKFRTDRRHETSPIWIQWRISGSGPARWGMISPPLRQTHCL